MPQGDETALALSLRECGYQPARCAIIADASGEFQAIDRSRRGAENASFSQLRNAGWVNLFKPDDSMNKNPLIIERIRATNALMKNATGKRRLFSLPENLELNDAIKLWENRNGIPSRRSQYAHLGDALSYVAWRLYPRREAPKAPMLPKPGSWHAASKPRGMRIL